MVLVQGLDVSALAVNVLLIYFSKTARHNNEKKVKVGVGWGADQASYIILHYFHFALKKNLTLKSFRNGLLTPHNMSRESHLRTFVGNQTTNVPFWPV